MEVADLGTGGVEPQLVSSPGKGQRQRWLPRGIARKAEERTSMSDSPQVAPAGSPFGDLKTLAQLFQLLRFSPSKLK